MKNIMSSPCTFELLEDENCLFDLSKEKESKKEMKALIRLFIHRFLSGLIRTMVINFINVREMGNQSIIS